jgi:phospholipid/cholesterol/gamma-HCH transport system permease protein
MSAAPSTSTTSPLTIRRPDGQRLVIELAGEWRARPGLPGIDEVTRDLTKADRPRTMEFETSRLKEWDSGLLVFLVKCFDLCQEQGLEFRAETLPAGLGKLILLSRIVPEKTDAQRADDPKPSWIQRIGERGLQQWKGGRDVLKFLGESLNALGRLLRGKAQFRWSDAWLTMQECGPNALGIVALINFLVGLILAFVGSIQLAQFGASSYVADLVAIATIREMGCMMTGIIICGRTGAAFAAQLGTMKVNEELNAFTTFGISPAEFLILPRILALFFMMPLLCVFADLIGIAGGYLVSMSILDVTSVEYLNRTLDAISLSNFLLGIFKGSVFGVLVALTGCLRGMQCGDNSAAVGEATTSAVVAGITAIIAADGVFAILCNALKI